MLTLAIDGTGPLYGRIADAVVRAVRSGRLEPGDSLPGTRSLASDLGVHRNTVVAAYRELRAQGWIEGEIGAGTWVCRTLPEAPPAGARSAPGCGFALPDRPPVATWGPLPRGALDLLGGTPDVRLIPAEALTRALRRAMRARRGTALAYADPRGHPRLLDALGRMLAETRGVAATPDRLMVTRGSQQAIDLCARTLLRPGDRVAVEAWGYRPAWTALRNAGAELVPVRVDAEGIVVGEIPGDVRAIYVTPHHQYPTTVPMSSTRRSALLELARRRRIAVLEDDYDHEFHYDGRPILPLASADEAGVVVYVGTLSKVLAPGLRIGYVAGPSPFISRMVELRFVSDRQGDHAMEAAVAELIDDDELGRHIRRMKRIYGERRAVFDQLLRTRMKGLLTYELPFGGMALWCRYHGDDVERWRSACADRGVYFRSAAHFRYDGAAEPFVRLGFSACTPDELVDAAARLAAAARD